MFKINIIKKDGRTEPFDSKKIETAISKSARRIDYELSKNEIDRIVESVLKQIEKTNDPEITVDVSKMHIYVEKALDSVVPNVAKSYKDYRNYKQEYNKMMATLMKEVDTLDLEGDRSNANTDSRLVTSKRYLVGSCLSKMRYLNNNLSTKERTEHDEGYIYIHDLNQRLYTLNCCVFDIKNLFDGGFKMGSIEYTEPKTLTTAMNLLGDVILSASSQQYGGFTVPEVDTFLEPYALLSYKKYYNEYLEIVGANNKSDDELARNLFVDENAQNYALKKVRNDFKQGFQGIECMLNSCASARGDYSFVSFTFGLGEGLFERMASEVCLEVRMEGQGKNGFKKPVLFPKLIFLFDETKHTKDGKLTELFERAIDCSMKCMYPDFFNVRQVEEETVRNYEKYGKAISPMGCRSLVSPFYESGSFKQKDESDFPVTVGRFNIGVVSLNLIMIYAKAKEEGKDFFELLDYYLEMIRNIHKKTYVQLSKIKASSYPLAFMEGGFWHGNLKANDIIEPCLKACTASFGITGLNELEQLANNKSLVEDGSFSLRVCDHIYNKIQVFKEEDGIAYSIYGTPAETLSGKQVEQFRAKYGIIKNVSDREYLSNSFHCHVTEDISPILKQDLEERFWKYFSGGRIVYNRFETDKNRLAFKIFILEAMKKHFYYGINIAKAYCADCGTEFVNIDDTCIKCGSKNLTIVNRVCGYLGFSKIEGDTRMNHAKMIEISERKSM